MANKGRKSTYDTKILPKMTEIKSLLSKGLSEKEIARIIGVSYQSWKKHKAEKKDFKDLCNAREVDEIVIDEVRGALHKKALGFQYTETKTVYKFDEDGNKHIDRIEETTKTAEPDIQAINLFLKNYDKDNWANDPQALELQKRAMELKEKEFNNNNW